MENLLLFAEINFVAIAITLVIGAVCGFLAGMILKGSGFGMIGNIIIGILGALVGSFIFSMLGINIGVNLLGEIITGTVGALILLVILGYVQKTVGKSG